jgi:hypothetical protein
MSHKTTAEATDGGTISPREIGEELRELATSIGTPSKPLLGVLPIRRIIPQDLHSLGDYGNGFRVMAAGLFAKSSKARAASLALGVSIVSVSTMTNYRLSPLKLIPIEAHEVLDYLWGASAVAAPFVLGYAKRDRLTATAHVLVGATHILMSLFTDYRAARGKGTHKGAPAERIGRAVQP